MWPIYSRQEKAVKPELLTHSIKLARGKILKFRFQVFLPTPWLVSIPVWQPVLKTLGVDSFFLNLDGRLAGQTDGEVSNVSGSAPLIIFQKSAELKKCCNLHWNKRNSGMRITEKYWKITCLVLNFQTSLKVWYQTCIRNKCSIANIQSGLNIQHWTFRTLSPHVFVTRHQQVLIVVLNPACEPCDSPHPLPSPLFAIKLISSNFDIFQALIKPAILQYHVDKIGTMYV